MTADTPAALAPYRVLDLTTDVGALCSRFFAGLGADVIRIEPPGGHRTRQRGPFLRAANADGAPDISLYWIQMNQGKRSLTLDLDRAADRETLLRLCETADFLIESFAPGHLATLGLDYPQVQVRAPHLIYASITPFGQDGPKAHWQASDLVGLAAGGLLFLCGDTDRPPVRPTVEQAYAQAGLQAAVGSMIALHARHLTGRGQHVDVSIQDAVANALGSARLYYAMNGMITHRAGGGRAYADQGTRMIYPSNDGYIALMRVPESFAALAQWMDDVGASYHFDPVAWSSRSLVGPGMPTPEETAALDRDFEPFFQARSTNDLYEEGQRRGVFICPVSRMQDLAHNPQLTARDHFTDLWYDDLQQTLRTPGAPFKMSATPWRPGPPAPTPGQHTDEILADLPPTSSPRSSP